MSQKLIRYRPLGYFFSVIFRTALYLIVRLSEGLNEKVLKPPNGEEKKRKKIKAVFWKFILFNQQKKFKKFEKNIENYFQNLFRECRYTIMQFSVNQATKRYS